MIFNRTKSAKFCTKHSKKFINVQALMGNTAGPAFTGHSRRQRYAEG